jgi:hypothetical protein
MADIPKSTTPKTGFMDKLKSAKWWMIIIAIVILFILVFVALAKENFNPYDPMTIKLIQEQARADPRLSSKPSRECMLPYNPKYFYQEGMENPQLIKMLYGK